MIHSKPSTFRLAFYGNKFCTLLAHIQKVRPLLHIPHDPWPGNIQQGSEILEQWGGYVTHKPSPDFWAHPLVENSESFTSFEWIRHMRAVGDNRSRKFVRFMITSWIKYHKHISPSLFTPYLAALRLNYALGFYEFYAQSAEDHFLKLLHKYVFREYAKLKSIALHLPFDFEAVCILKSMLMASLAYGASQKMVAQLMSRLIKNLTHILYSDGFLQDGRVDHQFQLVCHLVELRNFLRLNHDPAGAEKLQSFIDRVTPPLRLLRHGDGRLSMLSGMQTTHAAHVDAVLSLSETPGRHPQRSEHAGFEKMILGPHMLLMRTKPAPFLPQSSENLVFEWSFGKERILMACDTILESESRKPLTSIRQASVQKYSEKDHVYMEADLQDKDFSHLRQLYLTEGIDLRGQEILKTSVTGFGALRFIFHPDVRIESHKSKKAVVLVNRKGDRWTLTLAGIDGITTDFVQVLGARPCIVFALFRLNPLLPAEIKWSLRGI